MHTPPQLDNTEMFKNCTKSSESEEEKVREQKLSREIKVDERRFLLGGVSDERVRTPESYY